MSKPKDGPFPIDDELRVPVAMFLSGIVTKLEGVSFCLDGATHLMHTITANGPQAQRLTTSNQAIKNELHRVAGTRLRVTVVGHFVYGPECHHFDAVFLKETVELAKQLGV